MSRIDPDSTAETLRARYEDVVHHEASHELDAEAFASMRASPRGWGVGALVVDAADRVLLVRENGQWYVPGGRLEAEESPEMGAVREVREETGVDVSLSGLAGIAEQTFSHQTTAESFVFRFAMFEATPETTDVADDPGLPDESISSVEWHTSVPADTYTRDLVVELLGQRGSH